ncbi:MAG TPA: FAD/NAD(P)-binding protein [Pyrinomonadaceae bacterium]|nr:FAD/NAD(P)-binding protein [Pyrinomonadaceae bacterium]
MRRITIIGGGASGTLLAANLLKHSNGAPLTVNLIEKRERLARGVAYSTAVDCHLLNVPAARMGAYPDEVAHFHLWLSEKGHDYDANAFVPRVLFGRYLGETLQNEIDARSDASEINFVNAEAVGIDKDGDNANVSLDSGDPISSDKVVLAFGNSAAPHPTVEDFSFTKANKYFRDPWAAEVFEKIDPDDDVFIVGTGLSMVDMVMHLHKRGHRGKIAAVSTRGLLPAVHRLGYSYDSFVDELRPHGRITDMLKAVRKHAEKASSNGSDWRAVIDSLRPHTQELWLKLPTSEKKYFMQHLSRYWNIARHRMAPEAAAILDELRASGQLTIYKGRLKTIEHSAKCFDITFTSIGVPQTVRANVILNCIGSESNFERLESRLVRNMIEQGLIRNDPISQGLDATPDGRLVGRNGKQSDSIYTLGTALKGVLWESTAIPEIRTQARDLALKLLAR